MNSGIRNIVDRAEDEPSLPDLRGLRQLLDLRSDSAKNKQLFF